MIAHGSDFTVDYWNEGETDDLCEVKNIAVES